jgi:hypothetical protein
MKYLRYALLTLTVAAMLFLIALMRDEGGRWGTAQVVLALAAAAFLFANFVFLLGAGPSKAFGFGRIGRVARLWLDAKEQDLQRRATPAGSPHTGASGEDRRTS